MFLFQMPQLRLSEIHQGKEEVEVLTCIALRVVIHFLRFEFVPKSNRTFLLRLSRGISIEFGRTVLCFSARRSQDEIFLARPNKSVVDQLGQPHRSSEVLVFTT